MGEGFRAPYPWFGGKARIAPAVWQRIGEVDNVVDPFFGSGALLLGRPDWRPDDGVIETANDADGFVCNAWRAMAADPEAVARWADSLVHECDLHARHIWLVERRDGLAARLEGDPAYFDAQAAGWWLWGMACWIGGGFCSGEGPWQSVEAEDGTRQLVHLGSPGRGVNRKRVHLGDAGQAVKRRRVHLGTAGQGVNSGAGRAGLLAWFESLSERMKRVRFCCGDWERVCGPTPTVKNGVTAVLLDPPYSAEADRDMSIYAKDSDDVSHRVRAWALANGAEPLMRIALCGYRGEGHEELEAAGWSRMDWIAHGGYGAGRGKRGDANKRREAVWFSPHCKGAMGPVQPVLMLEE